MFNFNKKFEPLTKGWDFQCNVKFCWNSMLFFILLLFGSPPIGYSLPPSFFGFPAPFCAPPLPFCFPWGGGIFARIYTDRTPRNLIKNLIFVTFCYALYDNTRCPKNYFLHEKMCSIERSPSVDKSRYRIFCLTPNIHGVTDQFWKYGTFFSLIWWEGVWTSRMDT